MQKTICSLLAMCLTCLTTYAQSDNNTVLHLVPDASKIIWKAEKVTGAHQGTVDLARGEVILDDNNLVGGHFIIDMQSIRCTDLKEPYKAKLERHLRSKDFFATDSIPTASLHISAVNYRDEAMNALIKGELTIKEITHPIEFPAKVKVSNGRFAAVGVLKIDRTKYDVRYRSENFFENLGDRAIDDVFELEVNIGAKR